MAKNSQNVKALCLNLGGLYYFIFVEIQPSIVRPARPTLPSMAQSITTCDEHQDRQIVALLRD